MGTCRRIQKIWNTNSAVELQLSVAWPSSHHWHSPSCWQLMVHKQRFGQGQGPPFAKNGCGDIACSWCGGWLDDQRK
eukprot:1044710-Rhodomonas_salina.1